MVLKISTTAASAASTNLIRARHDLWYGGSLSLTGLALAFSGLSKSRRQRRAGLRIGILSMLLGLLACGGGSSGGSGGTGGSGAGNPGTPSGPYTITVNGTVGSVTRSVDVALSVQ